MRCREWLDVAPRGLAFALILSRWRRCFCCHCSSWCRHCLFACEHSLSVSLLLYQLHTPNMGRLKSCVRQYFRKRESNFECTFCKKMFSWRRLGSPNFNATRATEHIVNRCNNCPETARTGLRTACSISDRPPACMPKAVVPTQAKKRKHGSLDAHYKSCSPEGAERINIWQ